MEEEANYLIIYKRQIQSKRNEDEAEQTHRIFKGRKSTKTFCIGAILRGGCNSDFFKNLFSLCNFTSNL
jgi:hypothetical protein